MPYSMIEHGSLWGNNYRHRWYIDGIRVSKQVFDETMEGVDIQERKHESNTSSYRIVYIIKQKGN